MASCRLAALPKVRIVVVSSMVTIFPGGMIPPDLLSNSFRAGASTAD
jgi:hypothetical protein